MCQPPPTPLKKEPDPLLHEVLDPLCIPRLIYCQKFKKYIKKKKRIQCGFIEKFGKISSLVLWVGNISTTGNYQFAINDISD